MLSSLPVRVCTVKHDKASKLNTRTNIIHNIAITEGTGADPGFDRGGGGPRS